MTFKPGQSGNPGGGGRGARKKEKQLREMLLHLIPKAVEELERMMAYPDHKQFCVKEIFDRCFGKAPQSLELTGKDGGPLTINIIQKQ